MFLMKEWFYDMRASAKGLNSINLSFRLKQTERRKKKLNHLLFKYSMAQTK